MNTSEAPNGKAVITAVYMGGQDLFYTDYSGGELETIPFLMVNDAPLFTGAVAQQFRPGYEPADQDCLRLTLTWGVSSWGFGTRFLVHNQDIPGSDFFIERRLHEPMKEQLLWHGEVLPGFAAWLYSLGIALGEGFEVQANLVRNVGSNIDAAGGAWKMSSAQESIDSAYCEGRRDGEADTLLAAELANDWSNDSTD